MDMFTEFGAARGQARWSLRAAFRLTGAQRDEAKWGLLFLSPWLIGFTLFYLAPMIVSFLFSLYDFVLSAPDEARFVGLDNWRRMLAEDPNTWEALFVTFKFALISLPIGMVSAFPAGCAAQFQAFDGAECHAHALLRADHGPPDRRDSDLVARAEPADGLAQPDDRADRHRCGRHGWLALAGRPESDLHRLHLHRALGHWQRHSNQSGELAGRADGDV